MSRAFPTFKIYFIEEDMQEWGRLDDKYSYQAIAEIDVTKSRTEAADVAVVKFFNTRGVLDRSQFGLHSPDGDYQKREADESTKNRLQETRQEQELDEFILKTGTIIKIKMGYSSDPELLDTVFTGMIAEIAMGDIIEVVAQGFGVELLSPVTQPAYQVYQASAFKVLDRIITSATVRHFGKAKWFSESTATSKKLFRRSVYDPSTGKFIGASYWRNIAGFRYVLGINDDTRDNNIWAPENSYLYNLAHGGSQTFITKDRTIWDVFREMQRRMPGYIATVLPFDNRATIYFGPADFMYWYTDEKKDAIQKWELDYASATKKSELQKIAEMMRSKEVTRKRAEDFKSSISALGPFLTDLLNNKYKNLTGYQNKVRNLVAAINGVYDLESTNPKVANIFTGDALNLARVSSLGFNTYTKGIRAESAAFARTIAQSELFNSSTDSDLRNALNFCADMVDYTNTGLLKADIKNGKVTVEYTGTDAVLIDKNGKIYSGGSVIDRYNKTRYLKWQLDDPSRKLVRNYHFKDSFHHIVANSITASSQYMHNKVTVEFGNEKMMLEDYLEHNCSNFERVSAQVDDDLWPESVREKIVQERNACTTILAWQYALSNLWEEMRKMYAGQLTLLGDASIKPYDIVMMSDYFTDMYGPFEVEQVVHHFSPDTGFVTTIIPNLICHFNNQLQEGSLTIAGVYMDNLTARIERIRSASSFYGVLGALGTSIGNTAANVNFFLSGLTVDRREPISFTPLMYAGRPYIAGVEGMLKTSIYEAINGNIGRFIKQRNRIQETIRDIWDTGVKFFGTTMQRT
jgi:hypothetical protein